MVYVVAKQTREMTGSYRIYLIKELASAEESQETEEPSNKNTDEKEKGEKEEELKMRKTGIIAAANELLKNSRQYLEKVFPYYHKNYSLPGLSQTQDFEYKKIF